MKVSLVTLEGELTFEEVVDGHLELHLRDGGELPAAFELDQLLALEVSGHPRPPAQAPPEPLPEFQFDESLYSASGERIGPLRLVRRPLAPGLAPKGLREPYPGSAGAPRLPAEPKKKAKAVK
jgi:hypothetical protein